MSAQFQKAMIGVGSNLDQPIEQVKKAFSVLASLPESNLIAASSLYTSRPQGPQDQDDYVNAAVLIETHLAPLTLLSELKQIEQHFGRVKTRHWGERVIDLDIIFYGQEIIRVDEPDLCIPHREAMNRDFVFLPILEIDPEWRLPEGESLKDKVQQTEQFVLNKLDS